MELTEKGVVILDRIARNAAVSQRHLAKTTGISLGLINVIIKRFLRTGFIRITHLNKRQVQYLLTPAGILAATRRTYYYATNTIYNYKALQSNVRDLIHGLHGDGCHYFSIHGDGDLREFIQSLFPSWMDGLPAALGQEHREESGAVILSVTTDPLEQGVAGRVVNVLQAIGSMR